MAEVFEPSDLQWRGLGRIPKSGLKLRPPYAYRDAQTLLPANSSVSAYGLGSVHGADCISGQILQGVLKPPDCPAFGRQCTPEHPLGTPMVSSEGACAAYYRYRQFGIEVS